MLDTTSFSQPMAVDQESIAKIPGGFPTCAPGPNGFYYKQSFDQKFGQHFSNNYDQYASAALIPGSVNSDRYKTILQNVFANANPTVDPDALAQALAEYWHTVSVKPGAPMHGGISVVSVRNDALEKVHLFRQAVDYSMTTVGQADWYETFANNVQAIAVEELEWTVVEQMPIGPPQTFIEKMPKTSRPPVNLGGGEIPIPPPPPPYPEEQPPITPNPDQPGMDETLFTWAANELGVEEAQIRAIAEIESKREPFDAKGRPAILHERHVMFKQLRDSGRQNLALSGSVNHPSVVNRESGDYGKYSYQWVKHDIAKGYDETAAYMSCSWGLFQIMGYNYELCGYSDVHSFVRDMYDSVQKQFEAVVKFIQNNGQRHDGKRMVQHLQEHNWRGFARIYNGPKYAASNYHGRLEAAYHKFKAMGY